MTDTNIMNMLKAPNSDSMLLASATEVTFAFCTGQMTPEGLRQFKDDPHEFLLLHAGTNIDEGIKLELVDNDDKTIHLALPYYEALETVPQEMSDEEADVAGGFEIVCIVGYTVITTTTFSAIIGGYIGVGIGLGVAIGGAVAAGVAASAALVGVGVAGAHSAASMDSYLEGITTDHIGNGRIWERA